MLSARPQTLDSMSKETGTRIHQNTEENGRHNPLAFRPVCHDSTLLFLFDIVVVRLLPFGYSTYIALQILTSSTISTMTSVWSGIMFICLSVLLLMGNTRSIGFCHFWIVSSPVWQWTWLRSWCGPVDESVLFVTIAFLQLLVAYEIWLQPMGILQRCIGCDPIEAYLLAPLEQNLYIFLEKDDADVLEFNQPLLHKKQLCPETPLAGSHERIHIV